MPRLFPTLEGFFKKRTPPGVQNAQPGLFQNMPSMPVNRAETGPQNQQVFNQEQSMLNTGMIGGRMNRRRF
jgi:hypothetical protein